MKVTFALLVALATAVLAAPTELDKRATVKGFDVSHYQGSIDWPGAYKDGLRFVFIKATEGTTTKDAEFSSHYTGATKAGFIRGGYHFAHGSTSATTQAKFFVQHGGGWSKDGITLPGMLDLERDSKGGCNGLSVSWVQDFSDEYHSLTGRYPIIYANNDFWTGCMSNSKAFHKNPLNLARYGSSPGTIPGGWPSWTFWQYSDSNKHGGDSDEFNGDLTALKKLATG